jgi:hypothetical protein
MFRSVTFFVLVSVLLCGTAVAKEGGLGLGVILGEPTGISGKLWLRGGTAIDGAAAWSFSETSEMHLHADYLRHGLRGELRLFYGFGVRAKLEEDRRVGIRFPVGIVYMTEAPLDAFLEAAPILDLAPSTDFSLNAAIGFRFFLW